MNANGKVFILNPNGVLMGKDAKINVGGLLASTQSMSNDDFMAGKFKLTANGSTAGVDNQGTITVPTGGVVALIAPVVKNTGTINANQGNILLASSDAVTITLPDNQLSYTIEQGTLQGLVDNGGAILAEGGHVVLTAKGLDTVKKSVINHSGIIEAQTVNNQNGTIELLGDLANTQLNLTGKLDASAPAAKNPNGGNGGFIETSAAKVIASDSVIVTTKATNGKSGSYLIDPNDIIIASSGGNFTGTWIGSQISNNGTFTLNTANQGNSSGNGDIFVNDVISWSGGKLQLVAGRNISIYKDLVGTGEAWLDLQFGQLSADGKNGNYYLHNSRVNLPAGWRFRTKQGSLGIEKDYKVITTLGSQAGDSTGTLQDLRNDLSGNYVLGNDIDASETINWNKGWLPVGGYGWPESQFTGNFDGLGNKISSLSIKRPDQNFVGLFGKIGSNSIIKNVWLDKASIIGINAVGGLVGYMAPGSSITNSHSTGDISGLNSVGGLVGSMYGNTKISGSSSTGNVYGEIYVGGLVGGMAGQIEKSYSTSAVLGNADIGGLVGGNYFPNSSLSQDVKVTNSYSSGSVNGNSSTGGLIGGNYATLMNVYSSSKVQDNGGDNIGGLVGYNSSDAMVLNGFFDTELSGKSAILAIGTGKPTAEMQQQATFTGWDFDNVWTMPAGGSYPILKWQVAAQPPVIPPVDPVTPPVDPVTPPVDPVTPPVDPVTPPVDPVTPPVDPVTPPTNPTDEIEKEQISFAAEDPTHSVILGGVVDENGTSVVRQYFGNDDLGNNEKYFFGVLRNSSIDEVSANIIAKSTSQLISAMESDQLRAFFGKSAGSMRGGFVNFSKKLSQDLKSPLSGKNIIRGAIVTFTTDAMKDSLPNGDYWESLGGIAIDMVGAVIDSGLTATENPTSSASMTLKFQVALTTQLTLIAGKAVIKDGIAIVDVRNQYKTNLESQANSILMSSQLLAKSNFYQDLGQAEKADMALITADNALKKNPVVQDFGLKEGWTYDTDYKLAQALDLKASGDITGAKKLIQSAIEGAEFFDQSAGIRLDHIPERMMSGIAGYKDYANKMIQILGLDKSTSSTPQDSVAGVRG